MNEVDEIIDILIKILDKISADTDVVYTDYENPDDLKKELEIEIDELRNRNLQGLENLNHKFSPTALFQELSISNGWGHEYLELSSRFDKLYEKVKNSIDFVGAKQRSGIQKIIEEFKK